MDRKIIIIIEIIFTNWKHVVDTQSETCEIQFDTLGVFLKDFTYNNKSQFVLHSKSLLSPRPWPSWQMQKSTTKIEGRD